jgi:hypothetical protein
MVERDAGMVHSSFLDDPPYSHAPDDVEGREGNFRFSSEYLDCEEASVGAIRSTFYLGLAQSFSGKYDRAISKGCPERIRG